MAEDLTPQAVALRQWLKGLHELAGKPTMQKMAATAGVSSPTLTLAWGAPENASWRSVNGLALALRGDPEQAHALWSAAQKARTSQAGTTAAVAAPLVASPLDEDPEPEVQTADPDVEPERDTDPQPAEADLAAPVADGQPTPGQGGLVYAVFRSGNFAGVFVDDLDGARRRARASRGVVLLLGQVLPGEDYRRGDDGD